MPLKDQNSPGRSCFTRRLHFPLFGSLDIRGLQATNAF